MKRMLSMYVRCIALVMMSSMMLQAIHESVSQNIMDTIFERVRNGDFKRAIQALKKGIKIGFDVNYRDKNGFTLLNVAVNEDLALTKELLEAGADPNIKDMGGQMALHNVVEPDGSVPPNAPLIIQELVKYKANVNSKDILGYTPLMNAVMFGTRPIIQALLNVPGIDIVAQNNYGETALDIAKEQGKQDIFKLLSLYSLKGQILSEYKDKFTQEQIKQLPLELQELLQQTGGYAAVQQEVMQ
jgi:ankyrin repeat protein